MQYLNKLTPICIAAILAGCSSTIHTTSKLGKADVLSLDAKQRIVVRQNGRVCAEPSPDAIVAQAAALTANANVPIGGAKTIAGQLAVANAETAASIAQRTQAIQLMRDGYYRICEAYMNDAITSDQYKLIVQQIDIFMIAMIGIEAIGGTKNIPGVVIGAKGTATITKEDGTVETVPIITADSIKQPQGSGAASVKQADAIKEIVKAYILSRTGPKRHSHHKHKRHSSKRTWQSYGERKKRGTL